MRAQVEVARVSNLMAMSFNDYMKGHYRPGNGDVRRTRPREITRHMVFFIFRNTCLKREKIACMHSVFVTI